MWQVKLEVFKLEPIFKKKCGKFADLTGMRPLACDQPKVDDQKIWTDQTPRLFLVHLPGIETKSHRWGCWKRWVNHSRFFEAMVRIRVYGFLSENRWVKTSPQIIPFVHRGFHYVHHPFWGKIPYFWNTHMNIYHSKKKTFTSHPFWGLTTPTGRKRPTKEIIPRIRFFLACSTASANFFSSKSSASFSRDLMEGNALQLQKSCPPKTTFVQDSHRKGKGKSSTQKWFLLGYVTFPGR